MRLSSSAPSLSLPLLSLYLRASCRGPPTPPELLDDQHPVVRLLRGFSSDCTGGRPVSLDAALTHHLHQCSYHLRLFRNWLRSGQDDPECLYGTPATERAAATALAGTDCFASCTSGRNTHLLLSPLCPEVMRLAFGCLDGLGARLPGGCGAGCSPSSRSPPSLPPSVTYGRCYSVQEQSLALESVLISVITFFKSRCFSSHPEHLGTVPLLPSCR